MGSIFEETLHNTPFSIAEYAVFLSAYLLSGWGVLTNARRNVLKGQVFDENFLMTIATLGAIAIHQLPEAVGVMLFFKVGETFQEAAVSRSRSSISALLEVRSDSATLKTVNGLQSVKALGVENIVMLTGDSKAIARRVAQALGVDEYQAELLPEDKVTAVERLLQNPKWNGKVGFVGDGINDSPVIARADVGMAMGGLGSDAAIETADVVIMTDAPSKVVEAIQVARKTRSIV